MAQRTRDVTQPDGTITHETYEVPDEEVNADLTTANVRAGMAALRVFLALPSPTQAQTIAVVKLCCRALLQLARIVLGDHTQAE